MSIYKYCIPQYYYESVFDIPFDTLKKQGINTLFFDLDNTLMSYDQKQIDQTYIALLNKLLLSFQVVIVSNSGYLRVSKACLPHGFSFVHSAKKPTRHGYNKALKMTHSNPRSSAFIGDQLMTDIFGANRLGMTPILVKPVKQKTDHIFTRINRRLERQVIKKIKKNIPNQFNEALKIYAKDIHQL